jgi:hypothetical protein
MIVRGTAEDSYKEAIEFASEMAQAAPKEYREVVFQVLFEKRVKTISVTDKTSIKSSNLAGIEKPENRSISDMKYDWSNTNIAKLGGTAQYLAVIWKALDGLGIDGLTAKQVQDILFQKFRISKTQSAVSMGLIDWVGKYIDRDRKGNENVYRITRAGIEHLKKLEAQLKNER